MKLNTSKNLTPTYTAEGGRAYDHMTPEQALRRSVLSCLLWENEFYEAGESIADRIAKLVNEVDPSKVGKLAIEARTKYHLRHVPLLLLSLRPDADAIYQTVQRADELSELLAIYWRNGKKPIPAQMKKGLARAFTKFSEYQLAKYNRDSAIKLRDVLFMVHAKPKDAEQAAMWKRLVNNELATPDTWEVALSAGADKGETFARLIREGQLGYLALLRNLRNMQQAGVDSALVRDYILAKRNGADKVLPFRYIAAARAAPQFESALDTAMQVSISALPKLDGDTVVLVDVSGSMRDKLSAKSDLTRMDAAAALASIVNADDLRVFSFSRNLVEVPARRGMAGVDAVINSQSHGGTHLGKSLEHINATVKYSRIIVITDEQTHDNVPAPRKGASAYMINVASNKNGVGYGPWTHIDGFSENVIRYIYETENP